MFNLTVATAHTFFVGGQGWLVHNEDEQEKPCLDERFWKPLLEGDTTKNGATGGHTQNSQYIRIDK
ncbi:hypothetical protein ACFP81_15010 [Deinococcus lacus]|uniref:Uncharacterized protein n=1 Tax=Deinococcus lacus TaxID=392561 RepID=A0ABW1YJY8_9DEIO